MKINIAKKQKNALRKKTKRSQQNGIANLQKNIKLWKTLRDSSKITFIKVIFQKFTFVKEIF